LISLGFVTLLVFNQRGLTAKFFYAAKIVNNSGLFHYCRKYQ
jgi:hypothetical protein